jgi:hypothetical protein
VRNARSTLLAVVLELEMPRWRGGEGRTGREQKEFNLGSGLLAFRCSS